MTTVQSRPAAGKGGKLVPASVMPDPLHALHTTPRLFRRAHNSDSPWAAADFDTLQFFAHF
jgi:hypothetical protein